MEGWSERGEAIKVNNYVARDPIGIAASHKSTHLIEDCDQSLATVSERTYTTFITCPRSYKQYKCEADM